jgi:hypothetical protein
MKWPEKASLLLSSPFEREAGGEGRLRRGARKTRSLLLPGTLTPAPLPRGEGFKMLMALLFVAVTLAACGQAMD